MAKMKSKMCKITIFNLIELEALIASAVVCGGRVVWPVSETAAVDIEVGRYSSVPDAEMVSLD